MKHWEINSYKNGILAKYRTYWNFDLAKSSWETLKEDGHRHFFTEVNYIDQTVVILESK